jgi:hypothetical protein
MTGVSLRAYARMRGCSEGAVRKAIAAKRITPNAGGTIDPERANQEWERNTFAGKTLHQATRPQVVPLSAPHPPRGGSGMPSQPEVSSDPIAAYLRARAVAETYKAKNAQLEYEERSGKLIQVTQAGEYATSLSNILRDAVSAWPGRTTPLVASTTDEAVVHRILVRECDALLRKISKAISDAGY